MAFCSQCGMPLYEGASFCAGCGTRVIEAAAPQQSTPAQPAEQQPVQLAEQQPAQSQYQQPAQPQYQQSAQPQYQPAQPQSGGVGAAAKAAGKAGSLAKWLIPLIAAVVVLAVVAVFLFTDLGNIFKSDEELIRERIQAYEDACNDGDYEAMLDCMDSQTRTLMEGAMGLMDGLFSEGTGMDFGISDMFGMAGAMGDFCTVNIINIDIDGDYATVTVEMTVSMFGYRESSGEMPLPMVKEGGDWYIGGLENALGDYSFPFG